MGEIWLVVWGIYLGAAGSFYINQKGLPWTVRDSLIAAIFWPCALVILGHEMVKEKRKRAREHANRG